MSKPVVGIMYDFDKTLSTTDMQNYDFIPKLGLTPDQFWGDTGKFSDQAGTERILSYMYMMIAKCKEKGIKMTREYLNECGKNIVFYKGVEEWFKRINEFGEKHGVKVEHYLVSSGTLEIVEGCKIFPEFTAAWGCEYYFNEDGEPIWPKLTINYTQKTQFYFRILKNVTDIRDDAGVNKKSKAYHITPNNIIYVGDGMTDIACMTLIKKNGGTSLVISPTPEKEDVQKMVKEGRAQKVCMADYSEGSDIDVEVKNIILKAGINQLNYRSEKGR